MKRERNRVCINNEDEDIVNAITSTVKGRLIGVVKFLLEIVEKTGVEAKIDVSIEKNSLMVHLFYNDVMVSFYDWESLKKVTKKKGMIKELLEGKVNYTSQDFY